MIETIGIIAALITIGGLIWVIVKRFVAPHFEYRKIIKIIKNSCDNWKKSDFSNKTLIGYSNFLPVNRYKDRLNNLDEDELAFLLRCAVQNGRDGQWGYWANRNCYNAKPIFRTFEIRNLQLSFGALFASQQGD